METEAKYLATQFKNIYSEGNWLGETFTSFAEDVTGDVAFKLPNGSRNSIAAIVHHLIKWREFFFKKVNNDAAFDVDQEASFNVSKYKHDNEGWQQLLNEYEASQKQIIQILNNSKPDLFDRAVGGRKYKMGYLINGLLQHDLYHLGQIILLKKQLQQ